MSTTRRVRTLRVVVPKPAPDASDEASYNDVEIIAGTNVTLTNVVTNGRAAVTIAASGGAGYTDEQAQDAVGSILADTSEIDFTYSDATPSISAALVATAVTPASYGSATQSPTFTVDSKGRLTAAANVAINPASSNLLAVNTSVPAGNTVANTVTETAFASTVVIPANTLAAGMVLRLRLAGHYSTTLTPNITGKVKLGATVIATTGVVAIGTAASGLGWEAWVDISVFTSGAGGTLDVQSVYEFATAADVSMVVNSPNTSTIAIDTTASNTITVTIEWGTASASNTITMRQLIAELGTVNVPASVSVGGDATGTVGNITNTQARGLRTTTGPTTLAMGAVADGESLTRSGTDIIGVVKQTYHAFLAAIAALTLTNGTVLQAAGGTIVASYASDVYGDGADGDLVFDGAADVLGITPAANVYTMVRDICANDVSISAGVTVIMPNYVLYANGTVTFADSTSVLCYNGNAASGVTGGPNSAAAGSLFLNGGSGPNGRTTSGAGANATSPSNCTGGNGGAGGAAGVNAGGTSTALQPSATLGSSRTWDFLMRKCRYLNSNALNNCGGGAGGGAGGATLVTGVPTSGGGGGASAGLVAYLRYITGAGTIRAKGGVGGNASFTGTSVAGGGGGGGGGRIWLITATPSQPCTLDVSGGTGGSGANGGASGSDGSTGSTVVLRVA
jgi:hypothetical protein